MITFDDWLTPEFAGQYVVMDPVVINPPSAESVGTIKLTVHQYNPNAFTDVSDPVGEIYATVPSANLSLLDPPPLVNVCWVLQYQPEYATSGSGSSETVTVTFLNLVLHIAGFALPTAYATASWAGLTAGQFYILYIDDPAGTGVTFTPGFQ